MSANQIGFLTYTSDHIFLLQTIIGKIEKKRIRKKNSEVQRLFSSNAKAMKILNWSPKHGGISGFKKGLKKTMKIS